MYAYISKFGLDLGSIRTLKNVGKYVSLLIIQNLYAGVSDAVITNKIKIAYIWLIYDLLL